MPVTPIIQVTDHAWRRWRERAAPYADAPREDVVAAVQAARLIPAAEAFPHPSLRRSEGFHYFWHEGAQVYFIAEAVDRTTIRIVSVIDPVTRNFLMPKQKRPREPEPSAAEGPVQSATEVVVATPPLDWPAEPPFADILLEQRWLIRQRIVILRSLDDPALLPARRQWLTHCLTDYHRRLRVLKYDCHDLRAKRDQDQIYLAEGGISYGAAIRKLLKVMEQHQELIARQELELAQLRAAVIHWQLLAMPATFVFDSANSPGS